MQHGYNQNVPNRAEVKMIKAAYEGESTIS
jgi:hypothetical protein